MSRGMVDIYDFNEQNESGFNFSKSITYLKNTYINNNNNINIHNINNNNSNKLLYPYPLLETFFKKKCNFDIPYKKKGKGSNVLRIKNILIHIK